MEMNLLVVAALAQFTSEEGWQEIETPTAIVLCPYLPRAGVVYRGTLIPQLVGMRKPVFVARPDQTATGGERYVFVEQPVMDMTDIAPNSVYIPEMGSFVVAAHWADAIPAAAELMGRKVGEDYRLV